MNFEPPCEAMKWLWNCARYLGVDASQSVHAQKDTGISILHATDTLHINYNLISRHVSVLATASSPSGSILARANNSIKIEKLNCDDPIPATKRAPFLIRSTAARCCEDISRMYARRVRQSTSLCEWKIEREKELANAYSARHRWVWRCGYNNIALRSIIRAFECLIMKKLINSQSNEAFRWQTPNNLFIICAIYTILLKDF